MNKSNIFVFALAKAAATFPIKYMRCANIDLDISAPLSAAYYKRGQLGVGGGICSLRCTRHRKSTASSDYDDDDNINHIAYKVGSKLSGAATIIEFAAVALAN